MVGAVAVAVAADDDDDDDDDDLYLPDRRILTGHNSRLTTTHR